MTAQELLERLQLLDETERIEAKAGSDVGKSVMETVCAFSNEPGMGGGWLLLGVVREEMALFPGYSVEGVEQPERVGADLATQAASMFNQPVRLEVRTEQLDGKVVLVVFVPEAAPQDKPVYLKAQGLPRGAYRRIGSTDQRCTEDDLIALYQARQVESFDSGLVPDTSLDDLSPEAIADYRVARREANPDAEELRWSDEELLQALGAVRRNAQGAWQPTVAGLVLLGKPVAELQLSEAEARALVVAREAGAMDKQTYREINKVDTLAASKALRRLRDAGLFTQKDRGSATWYQPTARMLARDEPGGGTGNVGGAQPAAELAAQGAGGAGLSSNPGGLTSNPQALSSNLAGLTSNPEALDSNPATRDDPLSDPRRQSLLNELPGGLAARVGAIGRRHPPDEVKDLVVTLCELRDWRAEELAALLGRKAETVRQDYLRPLLRAGRIAMTRPDKPNDPDQAYRASAAA